MKPLESFHSQSRLEQEYLRLLADPTIRVVSFDIFDTLLFRTCPRHSDVFDKAGEHPLHRRLFGSASAFSQYRQNAEKSAYEALQTKEEVTLEEIYALFPYPQEVLDELICIELETERALLVPNPQTDRWIDMAHRAGKTVILISDMYLNADRLDFVGLSRLESRSCVSAVFVSNEYGLKKVTGNLFRHIQKELGIGFDRMLHIGDHPRADNEVPADFGIRTLPYALDHSAITALRHETLYLVSPLEGIHHARLFAALANPHDDPRSCFYHTLGALFFGPVLWEFSHWLADVCREHGLEQLNFLMREGDTFDRCFSQLYPDIPTNRIYASRQSTFLPSLTEETFESLNVHRFKAFTIENFYDTFHLPIRDPQIERHKHVACSEAASLLLGETHLQKRFMDDIASRSDEIRRHCQTQHHRLIGYFSQLGVIADSALIDFGGGGTAIKRLADLLPEPLNPKVHVLFYQHPQGYKNLLRRPALSFLPYTPSTARAIDNFTRTYDFIETLLNAAEPTTVAYETADGQIVPVPGRLHDAAASLEAIISPFRTGIDAFFASAASTGLSPRTVSSEQLALLLSRLIDLPTPAEADFLGQLEYDEGEGSTHRSRIIDDAKLDIARSVGPERLYRSFRQNVMHCKQSLPWIQGLIATLDPTFLPALHGESASPNEAALNRLLEQLDRSGLRTVMVYGAGELFRQLLPHLKERGITIESLIDSRAETTPFRMEGIDVVSLDTALSAKEGATIVIASSAFAQPICDAIASYALRHRKTIHTISAG